MNCTHPDHVDGISCEDRAIGCSADCTCCMGNDFDPTVVADVPKNPADFRRVYDPEYLDLFLTFEIVDSRERSLFEFNLANKEYDKLQEKPENTRAARVAKLAAFYGANAHLELSPFEEPADTL